MAIVPVERVLYRPNGFLLAVDVSELSDLAEKATTVYPIASRCGVFPKQMYKIC